MNTQKHVLLRRRHCSNPAWSEALHFLSIFAPVYNAYSWKPSSHQPGWLEQMYSIYLSIYLLAKLR